MYAEYQRNELHLPSGGYMSKFTVLVCEDVPFLRKGR
jgi:hypothetical protein